MYVWDRTVASGVREEREKGETTAPESLEQLFWNSRHCTLASGNCRPEDGKHDLAIFTLFLWVILRLHFPTVYTVDRMPSGPVLTEIQAIWHTFASNSICQAWMLYDCPSVGTTVQYSHMAVTRQISYSRVFAQGKGYVGNLQGKYSAGNQSSGVLIIRSFPAQVLCNSLDPLSPCELMQWAAIWPCCFCSTAKMKSPLEIEYIIFHWPKKPHWIYSSWL